MLLGLVEVAWSEGNYQSTRDGKTLVWNSAPKPGDVATWSGDRDHADYAHGFGRLIWYTHEEGSDEPQLYARYWGRMVDGKLEGPVNVHAKGKTHHAIFINGIRVTRWARGTAPIRANAQWQTLVAKRNQKAEFASNVNPRASEPGFASELRRGEPESPAAGPADEHGAGSAEPGGLRAQPGELIQDLYNERWPKIDIDDSLRLLAFPPRRLR